MIALAPVTPDTYDAVLDLDVTEAQRRFIATTVQSLADAYVHGAPAFAAIEGETVVGFALLFPYDRDGRPALNIVRLMIDRRHQGRGLGRALLDAVIAHAETLTPRPVDLRLSVKPDNAAAIRLYESAGFAPTGEMDDDERVFARPLDAATMNAACKASREQKERP